VPQHVIQRLLCHASPEMTNFYAHLHDTTIRAEFERYCQIRVNIEGKLLGFDPGAATADAEWGQAPALPGRGHPAQRLLRPPATAGLPAP
jgi:hypothetical protein